MTIVQERPVTLDETGGLELFIDMLDLRTKRDATAEHPLVVIEPDDEQDSDAPASAPEPARVPVQSRVLGFLRRTVAQAKGAISRAVATIREATAWLFSDLPDFKLLVRRYRRGRHQVKRTWFGVRLSTASAVSVTRERRARAQQTSRTKEGVLSSYYEVPEYWISRMASLIETIREEHSVLKPSAGRHWQCN